MPRPVRCRRICFSPDVRLFKPAGTPARFLEELTLSMDELEALRLVDLEGRYQEFAADSMRISRPTLSRILAEGRRKVSEALVEGKAVRIEGGEVRVAERAEHHPTEECGRERRRSGCRRRRFGSPGTKGPAPQRFEEEADSVDHDDSPVEEP